MKPLQQKKVSLGHTPPYKTITWSFKATSTVSLAKIGKQLTKCTLVTVPKYIFPE